VYSAYSLTGTTIVLWKNWSKAGFDPWVPLCDPKHRLYENLDYWMYTFYLSKYLEFIDTVFLLLRAKPVFPPANSQYFLHVFHHLVTASIVWVAWRLPFSGAWTGPFTNSFVHTFMYSYYLLTDLGMDRRWGGIFVTPLQIVQFIMCMSWVAYEGLHTTECNSSGPALAWVWFLYLVFLSFFVKLFMDKGEQRAQRSKTGGVTEKAKDGNGKGKGEATIGEHRKKKE